MLKGKKGVFILIAINFLAWGSAVYRFVSAYSDADDSVSMNESPKIKLDVVKDSLNYKLRSNYEDPFLKAEPKQRYFTQSNSNQQNNNSAPRIVTQKQPTVAPQIQIPVIKYLGSVKNTTSGIATSIITLNGQSKLVKPNETIEGVLIKSFDNNELNATWGKEKIVARK